MSKDIAPTEEISCPDCDGFGEIECECCEQYSDCKTCESKGVVLAGDCSEQEIRKSLTRRKYADALEKDLTDLAAYQGDDKYSVLADHGFQCFSYIESKNEVVVLQ